MFGRLASANKNHRDIPPIALSQDGIFIDVHFAQGRAKFRDARRNGGLGFVTQVAAWTRIESHIARPGHGQPPIFWMFVGGRMIVHGFGFEYL